MTHVDPAGSCVTLREHATRGGTKLAHAELNSEATLNSVSLEMIQILQPALERWRADDSVSAVLITGAGDRAFSAGGDIQALYRAMVANHEAGVTVDEYPFQFFEQEYRLDYLIHNFSKPLICVGHAIVMGGGLGIFSGARFRVVSEKCRIAFPEVSIGLFPDAGGTWMLRNLVPGIAAFIGMTGSSVNAADALASGIATHHTRLDARGDILTVLTRLDLGGDADTDS